MRELTNNKGEKGYLCRGDFLNSFSGVSFSGRGLMGNKIGKRRQVVDEKYTRPQGLYQHRDIDHKKLRKLILESKLAPCYPGLDDYSLNLEECPICFLYYPSLNRSRCCMKGICTECFLQMKPPHSTRPTLCPFCKTSNYAVEYRGAKTKEEKGLEQVEEQKVIEAQLRIRQQELQDESERMKGRQHLSSSCTSTAQIDVGHVDRNNNSVSEEPLKSMRQLSDFGSDQASSSSPLSARRPLSRQNRDDNFDLDLEDIMVMEAIWLSIQEQRPIGNLGTGLGFSLGSPSTIGRYNSSGTASVTLSCSGGPASAAAALAERQQMNDDSAVENSRSSPNTQHEHGKCLADCRSRVAESGIRYAGSVSVVEAVGAARRLPEGRNVASGNIIPERYEEQMMLAMAVSLSDAQTRPSNHGISYL